MVGIGKAVGSDPPRAGPGRRRDRKCEIKKIWLQQTQCEIHNGNGDVRPSLVFGLQHGQGLAKIKSSRNADGVAIGEIGKLLSKQWTYPHNLN